MQSIDIAGSRYWFPDDARELGVLRSCALAAVATVRPLPHARSGGWHKVEAQFIAAHPRCLACGGATFLQVHHKRPFHLFPGEELLTNNLRTLCMAPGHACHLRIGHAFDWRAYNPHCDEDAALSTRRILQRHYT